MKGKGAADRQQDITKRHGKIQQSQGLTVTLVLVPTKLTLKEGETTCRIQLA